ncbi:MAG: DUF3592 domain-containing protein [Moraxellaceae bacterium]|nr:DUF3592 domain-containing protein [Moraxellaceae bacterium]
MHYNGPKGLFGVFTAIVLAVVFYYQNYAIQRAESWPSVDGTIIDSAINRSTKHRDKEHVAHISIGASPSKFIAHEYRLRIEYEYFVNGKKYTGNSLGFDTRRTSLNGAEMLLKKFRKGSQVRINYDPKSPSQSMLLK